MLSTTVSTTPLNNASGASDEGTTTATLNGTLTAGVTAEFNRNILRVVNKHLCADFDPEGFEHVAFYDADQEWIEMRLRALRPTTRGVGGALRFLQLAPL